MRSAAANGWRLEAGVVTFVPAFLLLVCVAWAAGPAGIGAAAVGITAAGVVGGYFAGNAVDNRWTAIEILP